MQLCINICRQIGNIVNCDVSSGSVLDDDRWGDIYEDMPAKRKLALYDYDPQVCKTFLL